MSDGECDGKYSDEESLIVKSPNLYYYRPQRSCGQGNIFTPVCHSFCSQGGGSASVHAGMPPPPRPPGAAPLEQTPPGSRPPPEQTPRPDPPDQTPPPGADPPGRRPPRNNPAYCL